MRIKIPLQVIDMKGDGYHVLIEVIVGRKRYPLVLDTGASKTVFDLAVLRTHKKIDIRSTHHLSAGLGTLSMESFTAVLSAFKIGKLKLPGFEVAVLDLSTINQAYAQLDHPQVLGVLGGDILVKYNAVIDYGKQRLILSTDAK